MNKLFRYMGKLFHDVIGFTFSGVVICRRGRFYLSDDGAKMIKNCEMWTVVGLAEGNCYLIVSVQ